MAQAHVVGTINDPGSGSVRNRIEWNVNGMTISSIETTAWSGMTVEIDVPENATVRLDVASIGADGQMSWASSGDYNVGSAPAQPPGPAPGTPSVGALSVAYWW